MKIRLKLTIVALLCTLSAHSAQYFYSEGNFRYRIDTDKNCARLFSLLTPASGVVTIPANVTYNGVSYLVTEIQDRLFSDNTAITGFTYGSYPTYIGDAAFYGCTNLRYFCGTSQATYKSNGWCYPGTNLEYLGKSAFYGCAFKVVYVNTTNITSLNTHWFYGNTDLTQATLRGELGESAFESCTSLTTVKWNTTVATKIPKNCFRFCTSLTSFPFSEGIKSIGEGGFRDCPLTSIVLPEGFTQLGGSSFFGHRATRITLPSSMTRVLPDDFRAAQDHTGSVALTINSAQIARPTYFSGVTLQSLREYAFGVCNITSLTLGPDVNVIGEAMMRNVTSLQTLDIQNTDPTIYPYAFQGCTGLTSLTLTASSIGEKSFQGCTGLTSLDLSCPQLGKQSFQGCSGLETTIIRKHPFPSIRQPFEGCTGELYVDDQNPGVIYYAPGDGPFRGSYFIHADLHSKCTAQPDNMLEQCDKLESVKFSGAPANFAVDCPRLVSASHYEDPNINYVEIDGCLYQQQSNGAQTLMYIPWGKKVVTLSYAVTQINKDLPRTGGCMVDARNMYLPPTVRPTSDATITFPVVLIRPTTMYEWMRWCLGPDYIEAPLVRGDVNGDSKVSISDINEIVDLLLKQN